MKSTTGPPSVHLKNKLDKVIHNTIQFQKKIWQQKCLELTHCAVEPHFFNIEPS